MAVSTGKSQDDPAMAELKAKLESVWSSGDYAAVAEALAPSALAFLERARLAPGERVLDIACGSGQIAIPAALAGASVTGIDIAAPSIEAARARARAEGADAEFEVADAEDLPFRDGHFDATVSLIGAMFAPRPERAAAEMARVTRPGGKIVLGNWTAEGFIGRFFRTVGAHAPPPDMPSPLLWGDPEVVRERLGPACSEIVTERRPYRFHYRMTPDLVVEHYARNFGPVVSALARLDGAGQRALRADLEALWGEANQAATAGEVVVDAELLEVRARRA